MSAAEALRLAQENGVRVCVSGADLILDAEREPAPSLLEAIKRHKAGIFALLAIGADAWTAEDWLAFFHERAGIVEFDGGLPRPEAEARAFACCVAEWLDRNPVQSAPGYCLGCGEGERAHDPLLPFGTEAAGHAWLHHRCWNAWHTSRKAQAVAALGATGIEKRSIRS